MSFARPPSMGAGKTRVGASARTARRFWANVLITAVRDARGKLIGFSKITRDLTERRQHEAELRREQERFRLLVDGVTEYAIIMLDKDGVVTSWNAGAQRIKGFTAEQILGKHISHFYTSEDVAANKPWQELAQAREHGRVTDEGWRRQKGWHRSSGPARW